MTIGITTDSDMEAILADVLYEHATKPAWAAEDLRGAKVKRLQSERFDRRGVVITMPNGAEFQVSIIQSKRPRATP